MTKRFADPSRLCHRSGLHNAGRCVAGLVRPGKLSYHQEKDWNKIDDNGSPRPRFHNLVFHIRRICWLHWEQASLRNIENALFACAARGGTTPRRLATGRFVILQETERLCCAAAPALKRPPHAHGAEGLQSRTPAPNAVLWRPLALILLGG